MKRRYLALIAILPLAAQAQELNPAADKVAAEQAAAAFAVRPIDESSPFFVQRERAKFDLSQAGQARTADANVAVYPKVKNSENAASTMVTRFFTDMFSSIHIGRLRQEPTTETLTIEPKSFSVGDRRELDTTYVVRNNTNKLLRLDFTTSQRIEIITRDASGNVIDKWSDDRAFKPQEGIIIINPKERIQYNETVPTRDMKPAEPYTIQADVVGYPDYSANKVVTPSP
ncbi:intracellular proteinase inhibitor [Terrimicrobium sacchariphilum]|uniref:Intracellular proteinase inhibitor n=1 Tax=Terrimicrobium sacchariphilum TaxID=690879 RepID=A0A146G2S1_TERSA|nr:BsuPI-related putative proteinase inhibitor [Terrimicrobium sacchariphilum]GAT31950.1 intracellular proteinase inhibitor [Terrimicrobium sacchariphilum]